MNIIQSFWTGNKASENHLDNTGGWPASEYHWMSWALSCLQLKKIFGEAELITDTLGKQILIDTLHLPYSKVTVALDGILDGYPDEVWALAKIHSYSLQHQPFLHFDGDFFLWQPLEQEILTADLVAQNREFDLSLYRVTLDEINAGFSNLPACCQKERFAGKPIISINAGVIGGKDLNLFKRYKQAAFDFITANLDQLSSVKKGNLNFIFEQYFFYCLAEEQNIPISCVSDKNVDSLIYGEYVNFSKLPHMKFIHPVGGHKKNIEVCDHLSKKLRLEYPDFYESVLETTRASGLPLLNKVYFSGKRLALDNDQHSSVPKEFVRTMAAIDHLLAQYHLTPTPEIRTLTSTLHEQQVFEGLLKLLRLNPEDQQLLSELYQVEKIRSCAYRQAFLNGSDLPVLCTKDTRSYAGMQKGFEKGNPRITELEVIQNNQLKHTLVTNNWTYDHANPVETIVPYNFANNARREDLMVFVPQIIRMEIDEFVLDTLDTILFNYCTEKRTVRDILQQAAGCFEEEEIAGNYDAFFNLITGSIIRLSYLNILCSSSFN